MREYQFRTTKLGNINTGIFRMEHMPSGLVVPSSIAQITFENQTPAVSTCVEIIEEIEATNVAIAANPEVDNEAERDLITQIGRRIARHSVGYTEETPASSDSGTGVSL